MAHKDIRQFRDPVTGVLRYSDAPQNVHFHLRSVCVRTRYPNFNYTWLDVPLQMQQSFSPLHFQRLLSGFYWRSRNPYQGFDRHQKLQKTNVTIEFTALDLFRVCKFIKIEVFAVLRPKLWPER